MPRKPRLFLPEVPVHAMQRGINKGAVFFDDFDYLEYLKFLKIEAEKHKALIHAYVLMTNHVHLLVTPMEHHSISLLFQGVSRHYVPYYNKKYKRTGGLWEGRFKASMIDSEEYLMECMRYIELNPVRAHMVSEPEDYHWSSYKKNALGDFNSIITPHEIYQTISPNSEIRQRKYADFVNQKNKNSEENILNIRESLNSSTPLGKSEFISTIEKLTGHKVGYTKRGRPPAKKN